MRQLTLYVNTLVQINGEKVGVAGLGYDISDISSIVTSRKIGEHGYLFLIDDSNRVIAHENNSYIGKQVSNINELSSFKNITNANKSSFTLSQIKLDGNDVYAGLMPISGMGSTLVAIQPKDEISSAINAVVIMSIIVSIVLAAIFLVLTLYFANWLSAKIRGVGDELLEMSGQGGDLHMFRRQR